MKNLILISIDDLRFDCIGRYFDRQRFGRYELVCEAHTPVLDDLAAGGVSFGQCIAPSSFTPPSHASLLTGLYPCRHDVHTFYDPLPRGVPTLAEMLKEEGFNTWAKIENSSLALLDLTRGMHFVEDHADKGPDLLEYVAAQGDSANGGRFVFIHLFDCHSPYGLIKGKGSEQYADVYVEHVKGVCARSGIDFDVLNERSKREAETLCRDYHSLSRYLQTLNRMRALDFALKADLRTRGCFYDEMISSYLWGISLFDRTKFKALLESLEEYGLLDDSLLVVTSDHGEARHVDLDGDIYFSNGFDLHEGHIRVPLIFSGSGVPEPQEISQTVSLVDVVPTVLDLAGITYDPSRFDGVSLKPLLLGTEPEDDDRAVFGECWCYRGGFNQFGQAGWQKKGFRRKRMVRTKRFKLVRLGDEVTVESLTELPIRAAVERLYNRVLGRFPNVYEVIIWRWLLERGRISIEGMFHLFTQKIDRALGRWALIDTERDYEDEHNLFRDAAYRKVREELSGLLDQYDQGGGAGGEAQLHLASPEEEQLKEHLRGLGYL